MHKLSWGRVEKISLVESLARHILKGERFGRTRRAQQDVNLLFALAGFAI